MHGPARTQAGPASEVLPTESGRYNEIVNDGGYQMIRYGYVIRIRDIHSQRDTVRTAEIARIPVLPRSSCIALAVAVRYLPR